MSCRRNEEGWTPRGKGDSQTSACVKITWGPCENRLLGITPRVSHSLRGSLGIYVFNKFPGDVDKTLRTFSFKFNQGPALELPSEL